MKKRLILAAVLICCTVLGAAALPSNALADGQDPGVTVTVERSTTPQPSSASAPATMHSTVAQEVLILRDGFGLELARFGMTVSFSYDGSIVYSPTTTPYGNVSSLGSAGGWQYYGVIGSSGNWEAWGGHWNGGHWSYRQGKFIASQLGFQYDSWYPWIRIHVRGNGTWWDEYGG